MSVNEFYDQLAPFYHLIYADWEASIARQASQLDSLIRTLWQGRVKTVLDAACGIGTQAIGLARLGYQVTGSDISDRALRRGEQEAATRGLDIVFRCADLRSLSASHGVQFDLVIACDNAIPHLLSDEAIEKAFREMYQCVAAGGGCLVSVRDYDGTQSQETKVVPYGIRTDGDRQFLVFQVWQFHGSLYDLSMYFIEDRGGSECISHVMRSKYYAVPVARLVELMSQAGFQRVCRIDEHFFQPLIAGFKD